MGASNVVSGSDTSSTSDPMTWVENGKQPMDKILSQKDIVSSTFLDVDLKFAEGNLLFSINELLVI